MADEHEPNVGAEEAGLEEESFSSTLLGLPEQIDEPFDPNEIKISRRLITVGQVSKRIAFGEVELAPDFQRRARIWDIARKSKLIESILLRIPLPVFYVAADKSENWRVVDGLQRLTTIYDFLNVGDENSFKLRGLEYLHFYEGVGYDELPRNIKRRIDETELNINVIESGTPDEVMFNVFKRINTGGITLNGQEIRHALNPGRAREFLQDLANSYEFAEATSGSVSDNRMQARELALRFCAFMLVPSERYSGGDLDGFLNEAMKSINNLSEQALQELEAYFKSAMTRAVLIFGNDAFRKRYEIGASRSPINRALFESISVNFAKLNQREFDILCEKRKDMVERLINALLYDYGFEQSISVATGSKSRVHKRFDSMREIIQKVLE